MKEKKQPARLVIWIAPHDWKNYTSADISVMYTLSVLRVEPSDLKPRNCSRGSGSYSQEPNLQMFDDFRLACHVSWMNGNFQTGFYGPRWDGYMILDSMEDIEAIHKGMKRCIKARESFPIEPTSFGVYVALMCSALGINEYAIETNRTGSGFYTNSNWEYGPIKHAAALIDAEIQKIRQRVMPEPEQINQEVA